MNKLEKNNNYGFTLIEMLVTISIIGILAGLSLFALAGSREAARDAQRKSDLQTIASALELYRSDFNAYPVQDPVDAVETALGSPFTVSGNTYLQVVPTDPNGSSYTYFSSSGATFILCANLEGTTAACPNDYLVKSP